MIASEQSTSRSFPEAHKRRFGVFVLGAGFSAPAGLPLAPELWAEVRRKAQLGRGSGRFDDDLRAYIDFRNVCYREGLTPETVNFEDFMAFLDVEHYLGLRGSDTLSDDGNETQILVKTLIGQILTERTPQMGKIPDIYLRFAEMLQPNDLVLTFNYDVLLERALETVGTPFRLFPERYSIIHDGYAPFAECDNSHEEVIVLKLHGSVDWFDRKRYRKFDDYRVAEGLPAGHFHPVFGPERNLHTVPVVDGPRFPDDPLREMHRVLNVEELYRGSSLSLAPPSLLSPSSAKILYSRKQRDFWWGLSQWGFLNFGMSIIGFSLSGADDYVRQVLYRIVKNYQNSYWKDGVLDRKKSPLVLVDFRRSAKDKEDFRRRYAFVNWSRARTYFNGLDQKALELLGNAQQYCGNG